MKGFLRAMLWLCACIALPLCAAEPAKPRDIVEVIEGILVAELNPSVLLKAGDILVPIDKILKVETAYIAATRRQHPRYTLNPHERVKMLKHFGFQFLMNALVMKHAGERKYDPEKFVDRFDKLKKAKMAQGVSYEQHLIDNGLTDEEFRRFWNARWVLEDEFATAIADADVEAKLKDFLSEQHMPLRRISHILVTYKGAENAPELLMRNKEQAYVAANGLIRRLSSGDEFEQLAKTLSDCPSRSVGGDLDFVPRKEKLAEPLAEAAYKIAKVGDVWQQPVETEFGFHVLKLTALRSPEEVKADIMKRKTLEQLHTEVRLHLVNEKFNKMLQQMVEETAAGATFNSKYMKVEEGPAAP